MPFSRALLLCAGLAALAGLADAAQYAAAGANHAQGDTWTIERVDPAAIPPKAGPANLEPRLTALAAAASLPSPSPDDVARLSGLKLAGDRVQVVLECVAGGQAATVAAVEAAGGAVQVVYGEWVQAEAPVAALQGLALHPAVRVVRPPYRPQSTAIVSEGVAAMGLDRWHATGLTGRGAKLAVLDLGFDGYWNVLGTELPARPVVRSFRADGDITGGGDTHGTAAAEVAFDVAPEATFYLVNFSTEAELGQAVDWLISERVQVISSSVGWPGTAYGDGRGTINGIVAKAEREGIVWVQAAGNYGNTHWTGYFSDPDGNGFHNFRDADEGNTLRVRRTGPSDERVFRIEVFLTWDDWDSLTQDYDLFLFRGETVVAQSTAFQSGQFPPVEHIVYSTASPGDYWVGIQRFRANRRAKLDLVVTVDFNMEYREPAESLVIPADSPAALAVGAVAPGTITARTYSSRGPTKDGRPKPDLVAADGVSTFITGPLGFSGTSASAPVVAGAATLYLGARPGTRPPLVRRFLTGRAQGGTLGNTLVGAGQVYLGELPPAAILPLVGRRSPIGSRY